MSSIDSYKYLIKVAGPIHHLTGQELAESFKRIGEMSIVSKSFASLEECTEIAQQLVGQLSKLFSDASGKQYVIVVKKSPLYDKTSEPIIGETWDPLTLIKFYAAEAAPLKDSVLRYNICADIQADEQVVNRARGLFKAQLQ
jgi:hypothetical protein